MKNRYILDPSGKIKFVNESNETKEIDTSHSDSNNTKPNKDTLYEDLDHFADSSNEYNQTYFGNQSSDDRSFTKYESDILFGGIEQGSFDSKIRLFIENSNSSFGFVNDSTGSQFRSPQFRSLNSFLDTDRGATAEGSDVIPFVDEFEFYTGVREIATEDNVNLLTDTGVFLLDYLADVLVEAAIIEGVILLNKLENSSKIYSSNIRKGSRLDGFSKEKNTLILGEYIFDEVDVFSKYFFEVLNYPIEEGKVIGEDAGFYFLKRLSCFFIGFTEWIVQDRVFDWLKIFKKAQPGFPDIAASKEASPLNLGLNVAIIGLAALDILLTSLTNSASLKRLMLLIKKFHTQKYWVQNQLYSAKRQTKENVIIDSMNYYYFKFFIERVNVGIKIWNREFDVDSVNRRAAEKSKNRLAQEFANKSKIETITFKPVTESAESIRKSIGDNNIDLDRIKNSAANALLKNVDYNFSASYNSFALSEIPSALMFNNNMTNIGVGPYNAKTKSNFFASTDNHKLPIELVNKIENELETEYMPFYFHDIRTNEILSFHAFIENISDSYSPEYTSSGGFGRIDDVKSYVKTTRSISLSFIVAAMNKSDHETMWYYINKLVTMVYPQWSKGESLQFDNAIIEQPFSQVPSNSPLIRLRIGDLIKSNYSRFNLARIFGLNEIKLANKSKTITKSVLSRDSKTGLLDVKPLGIDVEKRRSMMVESITSVEIVKMIERNPGSDSDAQLYEGKIIEGTKFKVKKELDAKNAKHFFITLKHESANTELKVFCFKLSNGKTAVQTAYGFTIPENGSIPKTYKEYIKLNLKLLDEAGVNKDKFNLFGPEPDSLPNKLRNKKILFNASEIIKTKVISLSEPEIEKEIDDYKSSIMKPFDSLGNINNPITQSYESGMSKGLAGHITNLDLNYNDAPWEIIPGSKAPMFVKITMQFAPIHDIPPGLDYKGMPRAVNYNVGYINKEMFGDPLQKDPLQKYKIGNE